MNLELIYARARRSMDVAVEDVIQKYYPYQKPVVMNKEDFEKDIFEFREEHYDTFKIKFLR